MSSGSTARSAVNATQQPAPETLSEQTGEGAEDHSPDQYLVTQVN
jgi:hypothetical protein